MLGKSIYGYVWRISRKGQIQICLLVGLITPLATLPLELQRRIVDHAVAGQELWLLAILGLAYLAILLIQGGLKYVLNVIKGRVLEEITRDLRKRILERKWSPTSSSNAPAVGAMDAGTTVSMLAAESEDIGGFASASLSTPLLQAGTIIWVMGYLAWVEPPIAALAILVYAPQAFLVPQIQHTINRLSRRRTRMVRKLGREAIGYENLADIERVKLRKRAGRLIEVIFKIRMIIYRQKYILTFLGNFLDSLGPLIVLMVGGYLVIRGQTNVSTLVVFISGFQKISDPWDQLISFYRSVSNTRVTFGLIAEAIDGPGVVVSSTPEAVFRRTNDEIL